MTIFQLELIKITIFEIMDVDLLNFGWTCLKYLIYISKIGKVNNFHLALKDVAKDLLFEIDSFLKLFYYYSRLVVILNYLLIESRCQYIFNKI
jgi:hypothetical protein